MDCLTGQLIAQGAINQLVLLNAGEIPKPFGYHLNLEVITTTCEILYLHLSIGQNTADSGGYSIFLNHGGQLAAGTGVAL
jgi:hypothetical protein